MKDFLDRYTEQEEQVRRLRTNENGPPTPSYDHTFIIGGDFDDSLYIPAMIVWGPRTIQEVEVFLGSGGAPDISWEITYLPQWIQVVRTVLPLTIPQKAAVRPILTGGGGQNLSIGVKISG